jgi:hypothetical protein
MKDFLLQMMSIFMPYMKYIFYLGEIAVVAGLALLIMDFTVGNQAGRIRIAGKTLLWIAGFYLGCQLMALYLNAGAFVNLCEVWPSSMSCKTKFDLPFPQFWKIGIVALVIGSFYLLMGKRGEHHKEA